MSLMQRALGMIYPDQCALCSELVDGQGALCGACWRDMPFQTGHSCDLCGADLVGETDGVSDHCDDCIAIPRPWSKGRAAVSYRDAGRRVVLGLKHGDRSDLVPVAGRWLARAGSDILSNDTILVPVPLHWSRLLRRRYNQSAELAKVVAKLCDLDMALDALIRTSRTKPQDGMGVDARYRNVEESIVPATNRPGLLEGRSVCLIDDVMTSGATLSASAHACSAAGASQISVLVLARVAKTP
ncbi:DNA utilization protein GntX [Boseongicola aestuarii]|uniref:DNA utilization protein GntX n=2 Tax=Boseongicola aestuarii TaxID=1470561 RepID=A0A238J4R9_9RHOB|nr:DNA utilization protein GntX [Boseongicola aestuarii]